MFYKTNLNLTNISKKSKVPIWFQSSINAGR